MPYFQNISDQEFRGNWILGDRQYTLNFNLKGNLNTPTLMMSFTPGPYNLSTDTTLTINYAIDPTLKQFQPLAINVTGAIPSATQAWEVAAALNANPTFAALWTASSRALNNKLTDPAGQAQIVYLQSSRQNTAIRAYITNAGAEKHLHFNAKAPIGQLPIYFSRHSIPSILTYPDSYGLLLPLNVGDAYTQTIIVAQGQDPTTVKPDWQLLAGRSGIFNLKSQVVDGSNRVTSSIEFPAGAQSGDLAIQTKYTYTGANTTPSTISQLPYTLIAGDLYIP